MFLQILASTPQWVFVLFAVLVWVGCRQLLASRAGLVRVTILPLAMKSLAVFGVISAFGDSSAVLGGWAVAAVLMGAVVLQRPLPDSTRYDAATRTFQIAGSAIPLTLMMGIFCTKYVVAVALAMHPELAHQLDFSLPVSALYGAFSGTFAARAIRLWKLAMRQDSQGRGAAMASMAGT